MFAIFSPPSLLFTFTHRLAMYYMYVEVYVYTLYFYRSRRLLLASSLLASSFQVCTVHMYEDEVVYSRLQLQLQLQVVVGGAVSSCYQKQKQKWKLEVVKQTVADYFKLDTPAPGPLLLFSQFQSMHDHSSFIMDR